MEICFCGIVPWGSQPNFTAIIYASRGATCKKTAKIGHILVSKSNSKDWYKPEAVLVLMVTRGHYGWCHLTEDKISYIFFTQTHIHTRLTALFLGLPRWAGTRKVKTYLDFTEARDSEWQWHLVLDRVRRFRPIQIHRFFAVNRIRYRYDTDFLLRFNCGRGAAWLTDQRLQTPPPPPQLITAVCRGPVAARRRMPLICRGQSNTATISKV